MPRFGLRALLIVSALAAFWLATFRIPVPYFEDTGHEIRKAFLLAILIASGAAAVCFTGRRRAFWAGFFVTMLILGVNQNFLGQYRPQVQWIAGRLTRSFGLEGNLYAFVYGNMWPALILIHSAIVGFASAYIFEISRQNGSE